MYTVRNGTQSHYEYQLGERCRKAGLLVSAEEENLLTMFPALTLEREEGLDIFGGVFVSGRGD